MKRECGGWPRPDLDVEGSLGIRLELAPARLFDRPFGVVKRVPAVGLDGLVFKVLVDVEEVLDFLLELVGHVVETFDMGPARIADGCEK